MEGIVLKSKLAQLGYTAKEVAERLNMSPQALNTIFNVADVKSGTLEKLSKVLNISISYFFDEETNENVTCNTVSGDNNAVGNIGNIPQSADTINKLLDEIAALRKQNEKLLDMVINK